MTNANYIKYAVIVVTLFVVAAVYYYKSSNTNSNTAHQSSGNSHTSNTEHLTAPTTNAPTRAAPTTAAPTTTAPTRAAPTTTAPTTQPNAPVTLAPTTAAPINGNFLATTAPTTQTNVPSTPAPTTAVPTMTVPTTAAPTTAAPINGNFLATTAPTTQTNAPATLAPTTAVPTMAVPTMTVPTTAAPINGNFLATTAPTTQTNAPATPAPTTAGPQWGPYGALNFTSATDSAFVDGMCDRNGVQYRTQIGTSNPLTEYGDCDNGLPYLPDFSGTWDKCILNGIDCGQVTIKSNGGILFEIIISPLPVTFKRNPIITYSTKSTTINCGAFNVNLGQVTIYYNSTTGERLVIRMGTQGSSYYLCRKVKPTNQGYEMLSGNVFNNYNFTYFNKTLNVVSNGCL